MTHGCRGSILRSNSPSRHIAYSLVLCSASSSLYQINMRSGISLFNTAKIGHVDLKHVFRLRLRHRDVKENCSASLPANPSTDPSCNPCSSTAQHNIFFRTPAACVSSRDGSFLRSNAKNYCHVTSHRLPGEVSIPLTCNIK